MKTIKEAKARLQPGVRLLCVENTYRPELNGTERIVAKVGVTRWQWRLATEAPDARTSWSDWPSGIKIIDADTFRIPLFKGQDGRQHTVTLRFLPTQSPEETGVYRCPQCGNTERFTGIDAHGYGGPDECEGDCDGICECDTELRQDFTVTAQDGTPEGADFHYEAFEGGGYGAEIGSYTKIVCRDCGATIWSELPPCAACGFPTQSEAEKNELHLELLGGKFGDAELITCEACGNRIPKQVGDGQTSATPTE